MKKIFLLVAAIIYAWGISSFSMHNGMDSINSWGVGISVGLTLFFSLILYADEIDDIKNYISQFKLNLSYKNYKKLKMLKDFYDLALISDENYELERSKLIK